MYDIVQKNEANMHRKIQISNDHEKNYHGYNETK